jgi:hypothetical protein
VGDAEERALSESAITLAGLTSGLPAPVAHGAFSAFSRLLGTALEFPTSLMRRGIQQIEDGTNARTIVSNAVAAAAAQQAVQDPELVQRALNTYLSKSLRRQANTEQVVHHAAEALKESANADDPVDPQPVEDDWMNVFERYAEDASSERMQNLWGRVLAGEIRRPRSFSLRTMRFLAEADQEIALLAERVSRHVIGDTAFEASYDGEFSTAELLRAEEIGLVSGVGGHIQKTLTAGASGNAAIVGRNWVLQIEAPPGTIFRLNALSVTKVGSEITQLANVADEKAVLTAVADVLKTRPAATLIYLGRKLVEGRMEAKVYWSRETEGNA